MSRWLLVLTAVFALGGATRAGAEWVPDAWITASTKVALLTTRATRRAEIDVDTVNGRVTLHGKVPSATARDRAEEIALGVRGVADVQNLLQIVPPGEIDRVERSDAWIRRAARDVIKVLTLEPDTKIRVKSVHKGLILLAGKTPDPSDHLHVIRALRRVPGVRAVATEVELVENDDVAHLLDGYQFGEDGRAPATAAADLWTTAQVKLALLADARVPALDVNVDTTDGVVTLFGIVPTSGARAAAERTVRIVRSVRRVENRLQVVNHAERPEVRRRDQELEGEIRSRLLERKPLKRAAVRVSVRNGVVRLTGTVPSEEHRLLAASAAREVSGVRAVEQNLQVRTIIRPQGPL